MIDQHVHSRFSPDSKVEIEEYIKKAKENGSEYLNITDHFECLDKLKKFDNFDYQKNMIMQYEYIKNRSENIYSGIEIGYNQGAKKNISNFLSRYDFSLILLSVHDNDEEEVRYFKPVTYDRSIDEIVKLYFEQMYDAVTSGIDYDILSHVGFIFRYCKGQVNPLNYIGELERIFKIIIKESKILEINGGCFRRGTYDVYNFYREVLKLYKSLGGQKICLGSDSHKLDDYCGNFEDLIKFIKSNGFDELTLVKMRKHTQIKI
ncbi:MAG: histidinol-phosphatase HisJ family protein [Bacilli bacterium]